MIIQGECKKVLKEMPDETINCCITSPPYWNLRTYGCEGQLGLEKTPEEYISKMVDIFHEIYRVMRKDGTLWINIGDTYYNNFSGGSQSSQTGNTKALMQAGRMNKEKHNYIKMTELTGIPWMLAFALRADGWYLRQDIIWNKSNAMPESVKNRCTKSHEYIFLLSKSPKYYYDQDAIREPHSDVSLNRIKRPLNLSQNVEGRAVNTSGPTDMQRFCHPKGRNKRDVWTVATSNYRCAHFATYPEKLILPCVLAGCPRGGVILDPFFGTGTTGLVAAKNGRNYIGIELNPEYIKIAKERLGIFLC